MKANQAFRNDDEAVSPVIAVILMVAITVVLAATVYVWVSGFGSPSSTPAETLSLSSGGAIQSNTTAQWKNYTIASSTSGMKFSDINLTLNGDYVPCSQTFPQGSGDAYRVWQGGATVACGTGSTGPTLVTSAGSYFEFFHDATSGLSGQTLRILDSQANSVILTLVVG